MNLQINGKKVDAVFEMQFAQENLKLNLCKKIGHAPLNEETVSVSFAA